jgi:hypothetical protein
MQARTSFCRWAAVPEQEWPTLPAQRDIINSDFDPDTPYGDRRQVRAASDAVHA